MFPDVVKSSTSPFCISFPVISFFIFHFLHRSPHLRVASSSTSILLSSFIPLLSLFSSPRFILFFLCLRFYLLFFCPFPFFSFIHLSPCNLFPLHFLFMYHLPSLFFFPSVCTYPSLFVSFPLFIFFPCSSSSTLLQLCSSYYLCFLSSSNHSFLPCFDSHSFPSLLHSSLHISFIFPCSLVFVFFSTSLIPFYYHNLTSFIFIPLPSSSPSSFFSFPSYVLFISLLLHPFPSSPFFFSHHVLLLCSS